MLSPQPLPWTALASREIADSAGNIVQYTNSTVGFICLAVNAHSRLLDMLLKVVREMESSGNQNANLMEEIRGAVGMIGYDSLAADLEQAPVEVNNELNRNLAIQFQAPELDYTGSIDLSLTLVPTGWGWSVLPPPVHVDTDGPPVAPVTVVALTSPDGRRVTASGPTLPRAISAAAARARI